jgi:hypothetical protein
VEAVVEVVVVVVWSAVCVWWRAVAVLWRRRRWLARPLGKRRRLGPLLRFVGGNWSPTALSSVADSLPWRCEFSERMSARFSARTCSEFSYAVDCSDTTFAEIDASWSATGARGANLSSDTVMSSILAESFSRSVLRSLEVPMGTEQGLTDTKLSRAGRRLVGGLLRRLYSKEV